ncbi:MAG: transcription elongation factor GreA [Candidatus Nealsonbacteria bacterium CG23_combo_of_CG06-09_8_20_14_all_36_12]|uniref:Transcription elongation factor GreA n=2 Tax=Candidatus Nealsoniibacteriota TaxID=1817911 RepID=A0A2H0TLM3_9BACT|nr:MAG: transcription elongation factor GreA [Candidatus Nealsonbacteria bacterium CG23_combo_of_CG06-09_8_20_14_all_36_12]PIR73062.1 MAG: transcription elongation factor GreA [Candidatus Nealsonbacteria bacterium CG10_big_fil_rev_8_21_14_0_10_36_23]
MEKYLTQEGLGKLKKELEYLKTTKRKEIAERLERAISFGDLTENAAYQEAKEAQAFLEGRILELEDIIRNAVLISNQKKKEFVQIGSIVEVKSQGKKEKFQIVGSEEARPLEGKISYNSPLGKALLNRKKGEKFQVQTPETKREYKILKIE